MGWRVDGRLLSDGLANPCPFVFVAEPETGDTVGPGRRRRPHSLSGQARYVNWVSKSLTLCRVRTYERMSQLGEDFAVEHLL